jgi:hypothetical protein
VSHKSRHKDTCATTALCHHLVSKHAWDWITSYKKAGIPITATTKDVHNALEKYGDKIDDDMSGRPVPISYIYMPEVFLDAIVK